MREVRRAQLIVDGETLDVEIESMDIARYPTLNENIDTLEYEIHCKYEREISHGKVVHSFGV